MEGVVLSREIEGTLQKRQQMIANEKKSATLVCKQLVLLGKKLFSLVTANTIMKKKINYALTSFEVLEFVTFFCRTNTLQEAVNATIKSRTNVDI